MVIQSKFDPSGEVSIDGNVEESIVSDHSLLQWKKERSSTLDTHTATHTSSKKTRFMYRTNENNRNRYRDEVGDLVPFVRTNSSFKRVHSYTMPNRSNDSCSHFIPWNTALDLTMANCSRSFVASTSLFTQEPLQLQ